jgi:glycyl-tRNA synthetase beta chain
VLNAVFGASGLPHDQDDDLIAMLARSEAVADLLLSRDGANLLTAYRRVANILRIEERKDGPYHDPPVADFYREQAEVDLGQALKSCDIVTHLLESESYGSAMSTVAGLRAPLDAYFDTVTVNTPESDLRRNRLNLLNQVRSVIDQIADFSRIEF